MHTSFAYLFCLPHFLHIPHFLHTSFFAYLIFYLPHFLHNLGVGLGLSFCWFVYLIFCIPYVEFMKSYKNNIEYVLALTFIPITVIINIHVLHFY
jgi:hypothetical protein